MLEFLGFNMTYRYGTRLRFMAISINTTLNGRNLGYPTGLPIREEWESFVTEQVVTYTHRMLYQSEALV